MNGDPVPLASNPSAMLDCALSEMEEQQKKAADHYFRLRPQLLRSLDQEALFRAGFEHAFVTLWRPDRGRSSDETKPEPDVGALNRQLCEAEGHVFSRFAMHHCLRCEAAITPGGYLAYTSSQKASARPSEGPGRILGCACIMCEYHRSAEDIERKRRAEAGESPCGG